MRPDTNDYFMQIAWQISRKATCARRAVGCILVDQHNRVLATGYNGVPMGDVHCSEVTDEESYCTSRAVASGQGLEGCMAIHAEQNALMQCSDVMCIEVAYVTTAPCLFCTRMLLNTTCKAIVFSESYTHGLARQVWESHNREWREHVTRPYLWP